MHHLESMSGAGWWRHLPSTAGRPCPRCCSCLPRSISSLDVHAYSQPEAGPVGSPPGGPQCLGHCTEPPAALPVAPTQCTHSQHLQVWPTQQFPMGSALPPKHPAPSPTSHPNTLSVLHSFMQTSPSSCHNLLSLQHQHRFVLI